VARIFARRAAPSGESRPSVVGGVARTALVRRSIFDAGFSLVRPPHTARSRQATPTGGPRKRSIRQDCGEHHVRHRHLDQLEHEVVISAQNVSCRLPIWKSGAHSDRLIRQFPPIAVRDRISPINSLTSRSSRPSWTRREPLLRRGEQRLSARRLGEHEIVLRQIKGELSVTTRPDCPGH
jgi:hypothetical protein